jgi:hypothetical protein
MLNRRDSLPPDARPRRGSLTAPKCSPPCGSATQPRTRPSECTDASSSRATSSLLPDPAQPQTKVVDSAARRPPQVAEVGAVAVPDEPGTGPAPSARDVPFNVGRPLMTHTGSARSGRATTPCGSPVAAPTVVTYSDGI